jgi:AraC-like DNA-binding protein
MILDRKCFKINDTCVIEKLHIKTPYKYGAIFQNEACFLHIRAGESVLTSPEEKLNIHVSESVLMKCGSYFADLIQNSKNETCEIIAIHLPLDILKELYKNEIPNFIKPAQQKKFAQKIQKQDIIIHFIESLDFYFQNPALVNEDLLKLKLKELILLLLQTNSAENLMSLFSHLFTPRQASLLDVVAAHLFSPISVHELAALSGRSLSAFKRDFETHFHCSPANYMREQKLIKAGELLLSTDFSMQELCDAVGFNDTSHFTKLFKQKYLLTPLAYRNTKK